MDFGDVPAWVAAVVALGSMAVAIVAAVFSSRQVTAAKTQAVAALQQAGEAEKARKAAENQVTIARQAVDVAERAAEAAERSARAEETAGELAARQAHDAAAPKFDKKDSTGGAPCFHIYLGMTEGPPLSEVTVRPQGRNAERVEGFTTTRSGESPTPTRELGPMRKGEGRTLRKSSSR